MVDFNLTKILGRGAFGKVVLAEKISGENKGKIYAIKILKKLQIFENDQIENAKAEKNILQNVKSPFLVSLDYVFTTEQKIYLVIEFI